MRIKTLFFCALIIFLIISFKDDLVGFYQSIGRKLYGAEQVSIESLISKVEKEIVTPPPLRIQKVAVGARLTRLGTIKETNLERAVKALPPLAENMKLNATAETKVKDMFAKQYFDHVSPSGKGPGDLADAATYEFIAIGENLALGNFEDDKDLVAAWMESPGHRANILSPRYTEIGVAVGEGIFEGTPAWLAVQEFGLPSSACPNPDPKLRAAIEGYQDKLDDFFKSIEERRIELQNPETQKAPDYNQKFNDYNQLVNQYNTFLAEVKNLVRTYNTQVTDFNECIRK